MDLAEIDDINFVQGPSNITAASTREVNPFEGMSSQTLLDSYESQGEFSPLKIIGDSNYFVINLFISDDFSNDSIGDIEDLLDEVTYDTYISGDSYNQLKITDYIFRILLILPPLTILIIFMVFRSH